MRKYILFWIVFLSCVGQAQSAVNYNVIKNWYLKIPSPTDLSIANSTCDQEVFSMVEFQGYLYIGMYAAQNNCQSSTIYKWDGQALTKFKSFVSGNHFQQVILAAYGGKLYVGVGGDNVGDGDIYVYDPITNAWTKTFEDSSHYRVHSMQEYNGKLYAGFGYINGNADVYEFNGSSWTLVFDGNANQSLVEAMAVHNGKLIVGGGKGTSGDFAFIYQFDGTAWTSIYNPIGTGNNSVIGLTSFGGKLYASFQSASSSSSDDIKSWDGTTWTTLYDDNNINIAHGPVAYNGRLYIGTTPNSGGGQILVYDGVNTTSGWTQVYQALNGEQEAFYLYLFNGELLVGYGFDYLEANVYAYHEIIGASPAANAGIDIESAANKEVVLDGSQSSDSDGTIANYQWMRVPDNQTVCASTQPMCKTRTLGRAEEAIELTVTDNDGNTAKDTVSIYFKKGTTATCGNGIVETGEGCDGNTISCLTPNSYIGEKVCNSTCSGFGDCVSSQTCGDGNKNGQEICDGDSQSCTTTGGYPGSQSCNNQCTGFGTCTTALSCGDGVTNGAEVCDGNSQACATAAGYAGTQACNAQCSSFAACVTALNCGDGICSSPPENPTNCSNDCAPPFTLTLEAENMPTKTTGGATTGGWTIWSNGYIEQSVNFPRTAVYTFQIRARGTVAQGVWPNMQLRIDQVVKSNTAVSSGVWTVYTVSATVSQGQHNVAIALTNKLYAPPEDRTLIVDKVTITN